MSLRARQREHTIAVILEAAAEVFGRQGYHATSMEEVAKATGCATATLYGYFVSKEELFSRVLEDHVARYLQGVEDAVGSTQGFVQGIDAYVEHFLAFARRHQEFLRVLLGLMRSAHSGTHPDPAAADTLRAAYFGMLTPLFERAIAEGRLPPTANVTPLAVCLIGMVHSASFSWLTDLSGFDLDLGVRTAHTLFLAGFPAAAALQRVSSGDKS